MYQVYVFDAYGTLFDVHSAVSKYSNKLGEDGSALSNLWRAKQLEYSWVRTSMGTEYNFWELTKQALDFALEKYAIESPTIRRQLLDAYMELSCYDEVPEVLAEIKNNNAKVAVLSNGSNDMLNAAINSCDIGQYIDEVLSVDEVNCFKPSKTVYEMVPKHFQVLLNDVTFQSSNRWDIAASRKFGFDTAWINRYGLPDEYKDYPPRRILRDLTSVPSLKP